MSAQAVWEGNGALRSMLVRVEELRPHPRNPRRGDVGQIRESLRRFGQQRPVLALPDGTLVAGHHVWLGIVEEGWTHIAVVHSDLGDEEVDAYLLADNRLADLGIYDDKMLAELLAPFHERDLLAGIGYTSDDVDELLALLDPAQLEKAPRFAPPAEAPYATGEATLFRIVLSYDEDAYRVVVAGLDAIVAEHDLDSYSAAVERIARAAH